jgi:hypothetical protein
MSENPPGKYEKVQSKLDKTINPYVSVKIPIPKAQTKKLSKDLNRILIS